VPVIGDRHGDVEIDGGQIEAALHGLGNRRAAVIADEQVVVVAGQDDVGARHGAQLFVDRARACATRTTMSAPALRSASLSRFAVSSVSSNCSAPVEERTGASSAVSPAMPIRTPPVVMME
jgi:hypothetical protein